ncbi:MAG: sulfatase [Rikenellaceae bacterium]
MNNRAKILTALSIISLPMIGSIQAQQSPNVIIIFCDDMGYGDLSCFGSPSTHTPYIDQMCAEGQKWSCFYDSASVSSPSRGGLLTGQFGVRSGLYGDERNVLFPGYVGGINNQQHTTIATYLSKAGYTTACVGKWHLGDKVGQMPLDNGFEYYFGIPYSNDMVASRNGLPPLPLYNQREVVETEPDQRLFTQRFTDYTIDIIDKSQLEGNPFFIYLAHPMPHVPIFASDQFKGSSERGLYGDVIEELDYNIGRILQHLRDKGLAENTIVVLSSDNGPWVIKKLNGGSNGSLRDGKASAFEGGFRAPTLFWGYGVESGTQKSCMGSTLDLLPTLCEMASVELPTDVIFDGESLTKVLSGEKESSERDTYYFYRGSEIHAIRKGNFKLHVKCNQLKWFAVDIIPEEELNNLPWLYNVGEDPGERYNIADKHPEIVAELLQLIKDREEEVVPVDAIFDIK